MQYSTVSLFIIGTELTRGIISDKHGQLMANELTRMGYHINRIVVVPDDGTLGTVLRQCLQESDIVILTGGLGPTSDDLTRSLVASIANVPLVMDQKSYDDLYARVGDRINGSNIRQVYFPQGFKPIPNPKGTAPGFTGTLEVEKNGKLFPILCYAMPGPPVEMHEMFYKHVLPELIALSGHEERERDEFSTFLIPESKLEEACSQCATEGLQWGTRAQEHRISLYISGNDEHARYIMRKQLEQIVGIGLVHDGDVEAVDILSQYLENRGMTISCAESCTGGLMAKLLTARSGSSAWFWGGIVSYANEAKIRMLTVSPSIIETDGAVSRRCVEAMAEGMLDMSGSDCACAISGIAGPEGGTTEKPIGLIWFAFASKHRNTASISLRISSYGRSSVRRRAAIAACLLTFAYLNGIDLLDRVQSWQYI
ncbi:MAG: nicotinamide-nucleotide amidohydrolase family protein [Sphaerochaetaceae bacterium]|nr:nicotinamide-nucleotide amidohydrolase family protein [Sphaerochaetaceae bacterium]